MANKANLSLTSDQSEMSVYETPDTTLVLDDDDGLRMNSSNINISMIKAEQGLGGNTPSDSHSTPFSLDSFAASSIGEHSPTVSNTSTATVKSTYSKRKRDDSPDSYSMVMEDELMSDTTDLGSDADGDISASASDKTLPTIPSPAKNKSVEAGKPNKSALSSSEAKKTSPSTEENQGKPSVEKDVKKSEGWYDEHTGLHMPDTVAVMKTEHGAIVYLVGTVHFSAESNDDVSKVIQAVQPHIVLVELCKSRIQYLHLDEETMLQEAKNINFSKIRQIIRNNGVVSGLLFIFLLSSSAHIAEQIGRAPGVEFRCAYTEAKKVPGCILHLGDRPLNITLGRVMASLSWWDSAKLLWGLMTDKESITKEEIEKLKNRGMLDDLLTEMAEKFPAVRHVFVDERDTYMAHSLQLAAMQQGQDENGDPVPCRVVGVVGIGHMNGIIAKWGKVSTTDIIPISEVPPPSFSTKLLGFTVRASFWGLVIYGVTRIGPVRRVVGSAVSLVRS